MLVLIENSLLCIALYVLFSWSKHNSRDGGGSSSFERMATRCNPKIKGRHVVVRQIATSELDISNGAEIKPVKILIAIGGFSSSVYCHKNLANIGIIVRSSIPNSYPKLFCGLRRLPVKVQ